MKKKTHWYKIFISECPACGRSSSWRERQKGNKPKDINKTHVYKQYWDYCDY